MITADDIKKIQDHAEEFFRKMTVVPQIDIKADISGDKDFLQKQNNAVGQEGHDAVNLNIKINDPQIFIGEGGQTLNEIQRILRATLTKKIGKIFYFNLDINDYKKKKIEYLKNLARDSADEVALSKEPKILSPMSAYERRIIHTELSARPGVQTGSEGEGPNRRVVIRPK